MLFIIIITCDYCYIVIVIDCCLLYKKISKLYNVQQNFEQQLLYISNFFNSKFDIFFSEDELANMSQDSNIKLHN